MNVAQYSPSLTLRADGIWAVDGSNDRVSYPTTGHQVCFEVEGSSFWFQHRNACIAALVEHLPPSGPIFDVGGGNGVVAAALSARGWPVVLVEPGVAGCRNAQARGLENVVQSTFEGAAFEEGVIPAVGLFDVIEHVPDDVEFLRAVALKLSSGGWVYATVPAFNLLWSVDDEQAGHFRRYSKPQIERVFESAGFKTIYSSYIFAPLPLGILLLRSLPSRLGILRSVSISRTAREHKAGGPLHWAVTLVLKRELRRIPLGRIRFGSTVLVAARRD